MSDDWISTQEARTLLNRRERQLRRYAETGHVRSRRRGSRVEYLRADIERLAQELPSEVQEAAPELQLMPPGQFLEHIRLLEEQIQGYAAREGYLRAQLEARPQLADTQALQTELAQISSKHDALKVRYHRARLLVAGLVLALLVVVVLLVVAVLSGWTVTIRIGQ